MNAKECVTEGYRSLAGRTLDLYRGTPLFIVEDGQRQTLEGFEAALERVRESGDLQPLREEGRGLQQVMHVLSQQASREYIPDSAEEALGIAAHRLMDYFRVEDGAELFPRSGISKWEEGETTRVKTLGYTNVGAVRVLYVSFSPEKAAYVPILISDSIHMYLLPEFQEVDGMLFGAQEIEGFSRLMAAVNKNKSLLRKRDSLSRSSVLHFLNLSEVRELARREGVNMLQYDSYLTSSLPEISFLFPYLKGNSAVSQEAVIASDTMLKGNGVELSLQRLLSLIHPWAAMTWSPSPNTEIGIGLFEYMRSHPDEGEQMKKSPEFHKELSDAFFADF